MVSTISVILGGLLSALQGFYVLISDKGWNYGDGGRFGPPE